MILRDSELLREFVPGTTGWTVADLDRPEIERMWEAGAYELVDGVLTTMPPPYNPSSSSLSKLCYFITRHLEDRGLGGEVIMDSDYSLGPRRLARPDAIYLSPADLRRQLTIREKVRPENPRKTRTLIAPTLVIEAISPGHEEHDRVTKWGWYADAKIRHYWLLDGFGYTLECYVLRRGVYKLEASGAQNSKVKPSLFPGLTIPLARVWSML
jgi:Uma2 family endonuclease